MSRPAQELALFKISRLSTIRFINGNLPKGAQYIDWDASASITKLPECDLAGLHAFSIMNEGKFFSLTFGVTVAVIEDDNLFRMNDYVEHYFNLMLPERMFPIYNTSGQQVGKAIFNDGAAVHPINRFETRVSQSIQATAEITLTDQQA